VSRASVRWIAFHKPAGALTSRGDPHGRTTVYDLLPPELAGLAYVGRLDQDTEGLLLLSNDGAVAHALLHPSSEVERQYEVGVTGVPREDALRRLVTGVMLEDGRARAVKADLTREEPGGAVLEIVLREGRKREVRRLCRTVGHPVRWLRRVRVGPVALGDLPRGSWRELEDGEVRALRLRVRSDLDPDDTGDSGLPANDEPGRGESIGSQE